MKKTKANTTPIFDLVKNIWMKKLCTMSTMSNNMNMMKGMKKDIRGKAAAIIALPIR